MFEFIQVTAEYSNAVLVVLLPYFSDFARKLDLPMPTPIGIGAVQRFVCDIHRGDVGGYLVLTNGLELWYAHGHVRGLRTPKSFHSLQNPQDAPRFFGPLNLTKAEALELARSSLKRLGYTPEESFTDQEPGVEMPPAIGTNIVPYYRFKWEDPVFGDTAVRVEIDANRKLIQEMRLSSRFFWRGPPIVGVNPEPLRPKAPVSLSVSNQYVTTMLPKLSDFVKKLGLPTELPVTFHHLERVELVDFDWVVMVKLKNGYWFDCETDHVAGFNAPDSVFASKPADRPRPLREYLDNWNLDESQAIELTRNAVHNLGYSAKEFSIDRQPDIIKHKQVGRYVVPRYFFRWLGADNKTGTAGSVVYAEVDAGKKSLKHLYLLKNNAQISPGSQTNAIPPRQQSLDDLIKFLDKSMGYVTNSSQKTPQPPKPPNPFE